jgi:predicted signal transduction protein with EAL and GGDEF domain
MGHDPRMTSVQVDAAALRTAARQLATAADELAVAHDQAGSVLGVDVPHLHGDAAATASHMLHEALAACYRLSESNQRLSDALSYAADHTEQLEEILTDCLTPAHGS